MLTSSASLALRMVVWNSYSVFGCVNLALESGEKLSEDVAVVEGGADLPPGRPFAWNKNSWFKITWLWEIRRSGDNMTKPPFLSEDPKKIDSVETFLSKNGP